jgi:hypothetical protein
MSNSPSSIRDIPYRPGAPGSPKRQAQDQALLAGVRRGTIRYEVIPPERRLTINGPSRHCRELCHRFTQHAAGKGGCPGVPGRSPRGPACLQPTEEELA